MKKDIYIIRNTINDKVYIGQSKDAAQRWLSHLYDAKYENKVGKDRQVIHKAIMKYGSDKFYYQILESQVENYDEREIYWIEFYNSKVPNGYNTAPGGNGTGMGINSPTAIFKTQEDLLNCIAEISSSNKTLTNIAHKYNCTVEVIMSINNGTRYHQDNLIYPLRDTNYKYSRELIKQIRYSLKYEHDLSIRAIACKYNVDASQVSDINQGKRYFVLNDSYPLRSGKITDIDSKIINSIFDEILNGSLALYEIATKYNVSRGTVSDINRGRRFFNSQYSYPLRLDNDERNKSNKLFLPIEDIRNIHKLLKTNLSIKEIAHQYNTTKVTIQNINNGKCKKYILDNESYPIRKLKR